MSSLLLHKVIVVGDSGVGKTSIINRYVHNFFTKIYKSTIGVDFALKEIEVDGRKVKLQLWDIAGQERYNTLTHIYYRNAVGAIVVFDLSSLESFDHVEYWKKDIDEKVFINDEDSEPVPTILLANKCDLSKGEEIIDELKEYCKDRGFLAWFKTSAKTNQGIDDAMKFLIKEMNKNVKKRPKEETEFVNLGEDGNDDSERIDEQGGKCCQ